MYRILKLNTIFIFLFIVAPIFFPSSWDPIAPFTWLTIFITYCFYFGNMLHKKINSNEKLYVRLFNFCLSFLVLYYISIALILDDRTSLLGDNVRDSGLSAVWFVVGGFILTYCFLYVVNYFAKSISILLGRETQKFQDYSGTFFMILFLPIGIWWLHPQLKNIFYGNVQTGKKP